MALPTQSGGGFFDWVKEKTSSAPAPVPGAPPGPKQSIWDYQIAGFPIAPIAMGIAAVVIYKKFIKKRRK